MEEVTVNEIREVFPVLSEALYSDAQVTFAINLAGEIDPRTRSGIVYITAHLLTVDTTHGKEIKSATIGPEKTDFETRAGHMDSTQNDTWWASTSYGRTYLTIRNTTFRMGGIFDARGT